VAKVSLSPSRAGDAKEEAKSEESPSDEDEIDQADL
jgi:hypothetical protein